jgi:hypothetical protein
MGVLPFTAASAALDSAFMKAALGLRLPPLHYWKSSPRDPTFRVPSATRSGGRPSGLSALHENDGYMPVVPSRKQTFNVPVQ